VVEWSRGESNARAAGRRAMPPSVVRLGCFPHRKRLGHMRGHLFRSRFPARVLPVAPLDTGSVTMLAGGQGCQATFQSLDRRKGRYDSNSNERWFAPQRHPPAEQEGGAGAAGLPLLSAETCPGLDDLACCSIRTGSSVADAGVPDSKNCT